MRFLLLLLLTGCSEEWAAQATVYIKADSTAAVVYENCEIDYTHPDVGRRGHYYVTCRPK
jgi:hypothetical protein